MSDQITATFGQETFSPVAYHSFTLGPVSITTSVGEGETLEAAYTRAYNFAADIAEKQFPQKMKDFEERLKLVDAHFSGVVGTRTPAAPPAPNAVSNAVATNLNELITAKQMGLVKNLAREAGVDADQVCGEILNGARVDEITKRAASTLIDHLKALPTAAAVPQYNSVPPPQAEDFSGVPSDAYMNTEEDDIPF